VTPAALVVADPGEVASVTFELADVVYLVIGLFGGAFLGAWYSARVKAPKLVVSGSGGGNGCSSVQLMNPQTYIGIRLRETVLFGVKLIGGDRIWGVVVPRRTTTAHAYIEDRDEPHLGRVGLCFGVGPRWGQEVSVGDDNYATTVAIPNMGTANLMLIEHGTDDLGPTQYRFYPQRAPGIAKPSRPAAVFDCSTPRTFEVTVQYENGSRTKRFPIVVTTHLTSGTVKVLTPDRLYRRWSRLR